MKDDLTLALLTRLSPQTKTVLDALYNKYPQLKIINLTDNGNPLAKTLSPLGRWQGEGDNFYQKYSKLALDLSRQTIEVLKQDTNWNNTFFNYKNIDFTNAILHQLFIFFFMDTAKDYLQFEYIIKRENPARIIITSPDKIQLNLLNMLAKQYNIDVCKLDIQTESKPKKKHLKVSLHLKPAKGNCLLFFSSHNVHIKHMQDVFNRLISYGWQIKIVKLSADIDEVVYPKAEYINFTIPFNPYNLLCRLGAIKKLTTKPLKLTNNSILSAVYPELSDYLRYRLPKPVLMKAELVSRMLYKIRPTVCASMDHTSSFGKILYAVGKKHNIPVVCIQHGMAADWPVYHDICFDRFACFGESTKRLLIKQGAKPDIFEITGACHYDRLIHKKYKTKGELLKKLGLSVSDDRQIIVYGSQWGTLNNPYTRRKRIIESICRVAGGIDKAVLVVKLHPLENDGLVRQVVS